MLSKLNTDMGPYPSKKVMTVIKGKKKKELVEENGNISPITKVLYIGNLTGSFNYSV